MSFKRGISAKAALNIGQPDFFQEFWEIHNQGFYEELPDGDMRDNYRSYPWVIPVYVYSLNDIWDGSISFDVCPVDFGKEKNRNCSLFEWRHSRTREDIGKEIFYTEEEAWTRWRELYKPNPKDPLRSYSRESIMNKRKRHMEQLEKK